MNTLDAHDTQDLKYQVLKDQIDFGIDEFITDTPVNRYKPAIETLERPSVNSTSDLPAQISLEKIELTEQLQTFLDAQTHFCDLQRTARHTILAEGNPESSLVILTGVPGSDEDREGKTIAGENRVLLTRMLKAIGFEIESLYLIPALPWRPPGNREPTPKEIQTCLPLLIKQLKLSKVKNVLSLGGFPAQMLTTTKAPILKLRKAEKDFPLDERRTIKIHTTFHPQFLIHTPSQKRGAWEDLQRLRKILKESTV